MNKSHSQTTTTIQSENLYLNKKPGGVRPAFKFKTMKKFEQMIYVGVFTIGVGALIVGFLAFAAWFDTIVL
jgi:hypothetical protein